MITSVFSITKLYTKQSILKTQLHSRKAASDITEFLTIFQIYHDLQWTGATSFCRVSTDQRMRAH